MIAQAAGIVIAGGMGIAFILGFVGRLLEKPKPKRKPEPTGPPKLRLVKGDSTR